MELESIFVVDRKIKLADREISVKSIELGQIPIVMNLVSKLFGELPQENDQLKIGLLLAKAIANDFDSVIQLFELTTDLPKEDLVRLNLSAATYIGMEVIKENADFFIQKVLPLVRERLKREAGPEKSKSLSNVDIKKKK